MSLRFKANQSFVVEKPTPISNLQVKILTQAYQPLINSTGLALYLTLANLPLADLKSSQRYIHAELCDRMNIGIDEVNAAIENCEALGLIKTYRLTNSHTQPDLQTILYRLQPPLDFKSFIQHPQYGTALYKQIGQENYSNLLKEWQSDNYIQGAKEITIPFTKVFSQQNQTKADQVELVKQSQHHNYYQDTKEPVKLDMPDTFDYSDFIRLMIREKIDHSQLTQELKEQVIGLHEIYGLSELEMVQVLKKAQNSIDGRIQTERLREIASKYTHNKDQTQSHQAREKTEESFQPQSSLANPDPRHNQSFPYKYNQNQTQARIKGLEKSYPDLSMSDYQLIVTCEQIPNESYLEMVKKTQGQGGFATDSEKYYVTQLGQKTSLKPEVINFLIYYLLLIAKRDNIYKGDLERHASNWQSQGVQEVGDAMVYVRKRDKEKQAQSQSKKNTYYQKTKKQEIIPQWMKDQEARRTEPNQDSKQTQKQQTADPEALRKRVRRILNKED